MPLVNPDQIGKLGVVAQQSSAFRTRSNRPFRFPQRLVSDSCRLSIRDPRLAPSDPPKTGFNALLGELLRNGNEEGPHLAYLTPEGCTRFEGKGAVASACGQPVPEFGFRLSTITLRWPHRPTLHTASHRCESPKATGSKTRGNLASISICLITALTRFDAAGREAALGLSCRTRATFARGRVIPLDPTGPA